MQRHIRPTYSSIQQIKKSRPSRKDTLKVLEQKFQEWEQDLTLKQSNLLRLARLYFEHRNNYLSLREVRARLSPPNGLETARYCLIHRHGFKFEANPMAPNEHRLVDIKTRSQ